MKSLLETTCNTRDLGGYACENGVTKRLSVLRSDSQKAPSEKDFRFLFENGITTIIDLRDAAAVKKEKSGFDGAAGFRYHNCPIEEGSGVPISFSAVPHSYMDIAESAVMPEVFSIIANAPGGVMFNCSAGKDRTGVLSALLLMLAGVSDEDIIYDYLLTKECNRERLERFHKLFPEVDMNIVTPCEGHIVTFLALFRAKYGGVREYLRSIGINAEDAEKIKEKLVAEGVR